MQSCRWIGALCVFSLLLVASVAGQSNEPAKTPKEPEIGKAPPDFELKSSDGKTHKLTEHQDKVVVLEWFNQDCPVTRQYTPKMKELATKYAEKDVVWLAIDSTHYQTAENDGKYIRTHEIPYPILMDSDGKVGRQYHARTTPHMFVINQGTLVYNGAIDNHGDRNYVADALDAILAGKEVPLAKTKPFGCGVKYKR